MNRCSVALLLCVFALAFTQALPTLDVRGFAWAENLVFDGNGNLFVSDTTTGILWRITLSSDRLSYRKDEHISAGVFKKINGLTVSQDGSTIYAVAELVADGKPYLFSIAPNTTNSYQALVQTPRLGNGLALHYATGLFYTTNEGDFIPGNGIVYTIDINKNTTSDGDRLLDGADGCTIDQTNNYLYISEVLKQTIIQYEIHSSGTLRRQNKFTPPGMEEIDDFCLSADGTQIFAADFKNGTIAVFDSNGSSAQSVYLMTGLTSPTAAKFGVGSDFDNNSVFVTEGGGFFAFRRDRRVLQSPSAVGISTL